MYAGFADDGNNKRTLSFFVCILEVYCSVHGRCLELRMHLLTKIRNVENIWELSCFVRPSVDRRNKPGAEPS